MWLSFLPAKYLYWSSIMLQMIHQLFSIDLRYETTQPSTSSLPQLLPGHHNRKLIYIIMILETALMKEED